ncbi:MAG: hypothetical protein HZB38_04085 [Planctomycetes bacterium]|nr:hypothetical protein [Planctomycetota bacterium]
MSASTTDAAAVPRRLDAAFFERLFEAESRPIFEESLRALLHTREPLEFRTSLSASGGSASDYAVWLAPHDNDAGALAGISVWFHDITARAQLRRHSRKSERLHSLGTMSGSIAHHYSNLLGSIAMSLDFALNMNTMSAMRRSLHRTAEAVSRATQLTRQLLAFAQADTRRCDQADLTEMVLYYLDEHESRFSQAGIQLVLNQEPLPIFALPREHFNIVFGNLITNAIEAMPGGGVLTVNLQKVDYRHVRVTVSDTGKGIPNEHMERLFEPFFTTKGELSEGDRRAAGMGLAVAHGLVNEMNGTVAAFNNPAGGARFEVTLPIPADLPNANGFGRVE